MIERTAIQIVATPGVMCFGWTLANRLGNAPWTAIDSAVRVEGRIVVWVDADADVSTAMISSLSSGEPNTSLPRAASTSSWLSSRNFGPWKAMRRDRHDDVDADEDDRAQDRGDAGRAGRVLGLLVDAHRRVPAPVDEDRGEHARDESAARRDVERVEPAQGRVDRVHGVGGVHLPQRDDGEQEQGDDLRARAGTTGSLPTPRCRRSRSSSSR